MPVSKHAARSFRVPIHHAIRAVVLTLVMAAPALSQNIPPPVKTVGLSGPRFGFTALSQGVLDELKDKRDLDLQPLITQFGWQFEKQFYSKGGGLTAVNELVLLLGGLEQGTAIPSATWMVGLRTREGAEFGVGPNVTPAGIALAFAAGVTIRTGALNVPMNIAVVPSKAGTRVSMLTGFNFRGRR
jgi:hypothetical protein